MSDSWILKAARDLVESPPEPQVRTLPQADLPEHLEVVATLIKKTDPLIIRNRVLNFRHSYWRRPT
jgi:hypothetical protein